MAEVARRQRTPRQRWAAPGSSHDRLVKVAGIGLPIAIGVLAAFLVTAPIYSRGDVSFVLDKNKVAVARERLKIQAAQYRGEDNKGRPFELTAGSAVQRSSSDPVMQLRDLAAGLQLDDGPAQLRANAGRYDMDSQQIAIDGPVRFRAPDDYVLNTSDAVADLRTRTLDSTGAVTGTAPQGRFSADRMTADLASRTVRLDGHARLRIDPRAPR